MRIKKNSQQYKVNYDKAIEVNNELNFNVEEQQVDIKHWQKQCDKNNED